MKKTFTKLTLRFALPLVLFLAYGTASNAQCAPDVEPPAISCPANAIAGCESEAPAAATTVEELIAAGGAVSDNCSANADVTLMSADVVTPGVNGMIERTYTATDEAGLSASCTQIINFEDGEAPVCVTQPVTIYLDGAGAAILFAADLDSGSTDNCSSTLMFEATPSLFTCANIGANAVQFTAIDESNNMCMSEVTVTVLDTVSPILETMDATAYLDINGFATLTDIDVTTSATDACGLSSFTLSQSDFTCDDTSAPVEIDVTVTDVNSNSTTETAIITVIDTFAPTLVSTMNDIIVQLEMGQCDTALVFDFPAIEDACDAAPTAMPVDVMSGDVLPIGVTEVTFLAADLNSNEQEYTFNITVLEFQATSLACLTEINLSIDSETCVSSLTPEMVLTTEAIGCPDNCTIIVMDENGVELPNVFTSADVGESFMYQVCCGGNCCMGVVNVEDKTPPQIVCTVDTISCGEFLNFPFPEVTENCSGISFTLINQTSQEVSCDDTLLQEIITREFIAVDDAGNESNVCSQVLSIRRFDMGTIDPPINQNIEIECGTTYPTDDLGRPDVEFYGGPILNGVELAIDQGLECNLFVSFEDQTVLTGPNTTSIVRTFTATNWYCGVDTTRNFVQIFEIGDNQGPVIQCSPDLTFASDVFDCSSSIELPALEIEDICGELKSVSVQYEGGFIDGNGGLADLPLGNSSVTYTAIDTEGNLSTCTFNVSISDMEQPIPVCDQFTVVSLTNEGNAIVDAEDFDDGSFDACGDITFLVRRMTPNCDGNDAIFGPTVTFCCADLDTEQMVVLRVTDENGNFNECMVTAEVQDKTPPQLIQGLPDITLACDFPFNSDDTEQFGTIQMNIDDVEPILLTSEIVEFSGPAFDGLVLGGCLELMSDEFTFMNINECGVGTVTRVITFQNQQGTSVSDVQFIRFENPNPFVLEDINFPNDITLFNVCDLEGIPVTMPTFTEDFCDQVGIEIDDKVIDNSNGSLSCFKVIRTFTLVDWCQNLNNTFDTFEGTQIIEVYNTVAPEITGNCEDRSLCSYDNQCGPVFIELPMTATDDCTTEEFLNYSYSIDAFSDGSIDFVGNTNNASAAYPVGIHTIYWNVNDGCGNEDVCSYTFELLNCKTPTPYCLDNLTAGLTPMDLDGDGEVETEMIIITPDFFDAGSFHVCGTPVQISFSEDVNDTERMFDCDDIGEQPIELWVTDVNGNQDFCLTSVVIQDNNDVDFCPDMLLFDITGTIKTETAEEVQDVEISLGVPELLDITGEDGSYSFVEMPLGNSYTVSPEKNIDPLNGISVSDIILIQKHILGLQLLDSPYKLIAADVDNSTKINGQDLIQIRKLLLGHYAEFPQNESWKFVNADQQFIDAANPWFDEIQEQIEVPSLSYDVVADFVGVKIGDVNQSATMNGIAGNLATRNDNSLVLEIAAVSLDASEYADIEFVNADGLEIEGLQFAVNFDSEQLEIVEIRIGERLADESIYNLSGNTLRILATDLISTDNVLSITVKALKAINGNVFTINQNVMQNMAYAKSTGEISVELRSKEVYESVAVYDLEQNTPNPWMNTTSINFVSITEGTGQLNVMDTNGKVVVSRSLEITKGGNIVTMTSDQLPSSGIYYYEVSIENTRLMKKMILIK